MEELMNIFRMTEISVSARIRLLKKVGHLVNYQYSSNVTEPIIIELIMILDPNYDFSKDDHLKNFIE